MKISRDVSLIDKEILDLSFINKFTRSQIEAEIKRQEKIFPILIKPQDNTVKLSEEEEELKHQLELNPNLFIVPNIIYDTKNIKNFNETRTSSPAVIVQAPAFIDTSRNGQQVKNLGYVRNVQAEPKIYRENVRKGREESTDNTSVSLQHLNLSNRQNTHSSDPINLSKDDWEPELLDLNDTGLTTDLIKERILSSDHGNLIYETMENIYENLKRIKVENDEVFNKDMEKYLRKITIGTSYSNKRPVKAVRELLKDIQHFSMIKEKETSRKLLGTNRSRDLVKENLKRYLIHADKNKNKREKSNHRRRDPSYKIKSRSRCRCKSCAKKQNSRKSKSREPNYKKQYNETKNWLNKTAYPLKENYVIENNQVLDNLSINNFDPYRSNWISLNDFEMEKEEEVVENDISFNIKYHENFRNLNF